jgi:hypothetical protein
MSIEQRKSIIFVFIYLFIYSDLNNITSVIGSVDYFEWSQDPRVQWNP